MLPERTRPPNQALEQPALRLVHAERRAPLELRPMMRPAHPLLVERMSGLMHGAEQQREGSPFHETRRDPDIVRADGRRKWMGGLVVPPALPIEAQRRDHLDGALVEV